MGVLINYDLDGEHTPVKKAMYARGYQNYFEHYITVSGRRVKETVYLPNTTLYHNNKTPEKSREDLLEVARLKNARTEHILAVPFDPVTTAWRGIIGDAWE